MATIELEVRERLGRNRDSQGIEDGKYVDEFLCDRPTDRWKPAQRRQQHADQSQGHAAESTLQSDGAQTAADVKALWRRR